MAKNTHPAPANTDSIPDTSNEQSKENNQESQISEQQEQVLDNQEQPEGNAPSAEVTDTPPTFEEIENAYAEAIIDDPQLAEHVNDGHLTKEQFEEIRGISFDEYMAEHNKATPEQLSFEAAQQLLQKRMDESEGKLNAGGASALVEMMSQRNEIALQTKGKLLAWLVSLQGSNLNTPANMISADIQEHYKPTKTLDEAKADAAEIIQDVIKRDVEFEGTKAARLVVDLADIAVHKLKLGELHVTFATTPVTIDGVTKQLRRCTMHRDLWNMIKKEQLLGEVKREVVTIGKKVLDQGTLFDPYTDKSIVPIIDRLCMKACLIAYGRAGIRFGYAPKTRERVSRKQRFLPEVEDESKYHKHVVVPGNVLKPRNFKIVTVCEQYQTQRNGAPTTSERWVTKAEDAGANPDESLVWLPDNAIDPVYQYVFADHELVYETSAKGDKEGGGVVPSGCIVRSFDRNVGDLRGRQRDGGEEKAKDADRIAALVKERDQLRVERDKAQAGLSMENRVTALQAIEGILSNTKLPVSVAEQCHVILAAETMIKKRLNGKPELDVLKRLVALATALDQVIVWDAGNDRWEYRSPDGSIRTPIAA